MTVHYLADHFPKQWTWYRRHDWSVILASGEITVLVAFGLACLSCRWISPNEDSMPSWKTECCAYVAFTMATVAISMIVVGFWKTLTRVPMGAKQETDAFYSILEKASRMRGAFETLLRCVRKQDLKLGTRQTDRLIREMVDEYERQEWHVLKFQLGWTLGGFVLASLGFVVGFAALFLADFTIEARPVQARVNDAAPKQNRDLSLTSGFVDTSVDTWAGFPKETLCQRAVESLYFSIVTFATLGYGDIHPAASILARLLVVSEVLLFLVLAVFGVAFGFAISPQKLRLSKDKFAEVLEDELERWRDIPPAPRET